MSKNCHHNEKPSPTGLFTKRQNLVADGQTSKMPSTTSGAGQTETNLGKQISESDKYADNALALYPWFCFSFTKP